MREIGVQECGCDRILPRKLSHDFVATMSLGRGVLRFKILTFVWTVQQSRPHQAVHACRPRLNSITATQPRVGSQWRTGNFQPTSHSVFPAAATSDARTRSSTMDLRIGPCAINIPVSPTAALSRYPRRRTMPKVRQTGHRHGGQVATAVSGTGRSRFARRVAPGTSAVRSALRACPAFPTALRRLWGATRLYFRPERQPPAPAAIYCDPPLLPSLRAEANSVDATRIHLVEVHRWRFCIFRLGSECHDDFSAEQLQSPC
jgi:hypothetical protein